MKKKELKKREALTPFETNVLFAAKCLCNAGEVSLHSFSDIFSPEDNHEITTSVETLALIGYIKYYDGVIYGVHNNHWGKSIPTNTSLVQEMLGRLEERTSISLFQDRHEVREYFLMGYSLAKYVLRNMPDSIVNTFALLLCHLVEHIDVWWPSNNHADRTEEIPIVQAMSLALTKIPSESPLASRLHAYISLFFTNAFQYENAMFHIKKAEEIDIKHSADLEDYTYLAYGIYYYNFGQIAKSLEFIYKGYLKSADMHIKSYASAMIGLILALVGEHYSSRNWIDDNLPFSLPEMHEITILYEINFALLEDNLDSANKHLDRAELLLYKMNHRECPLGGTLHYVRSQIWALYGYKAKSLYGYKQYVLNSQHNFKAAGGGWDIYFSSKIVYHLDYGSLVTAKMVSFKELDSIDVNSSELSFSVKDDVCHSYISLYKSLKLYPLAKVYADFYETYRKIYQPTSKTLYYIAPLFYDGIPSVISLDTPWEYIIEDINIDISMVEEKQNSKTVEEISNKIHEVKRQYPELSSFLMIAEGRLDSHKDIHRAIETWNKAINSASHEEFFGVSIEVARFCNYYGLVFESAEFYKRAIDSETFQSMTTASQFDFYMEYVLIVENCGFRSVAMHYWEILEDISNEDNRSIVMYYRAVTEWNFENYETCHLYLMSFFAIYKQMEQFDELLSSAYCYYSSLLSRFGEYESGLEAIHKAMSLWIDPHSDTLPLYCNKASCEIGLKMWNDARDTLKTAEKFSRTQKDKEIVQDLYDYLHEQRTLYYKGK